MKRWLTWRPSILALALAAALAGSVEASAMDHSGFCSWDELTTKNCKNVKIGNWTWECWCPVLTTPPPPT